MDDDTFTIKDYILYTLLAIGWILIGLLVVEPIMKFFKFQESDLGGIIGTALWLLIGFGIYYLYNALRSRLKSKK